MLVGCSSGDGSAGPAQPDPTTASPPPLEAAVRAYSAAFLGNEADTAYEMLTERCQGETAQAEFQRSVSRASELFGDAKMTSYADEVDGQVGSATYGFDASTIDQVSERWLLVGGSWRNDDC